MRRTENPIKDKFEPHWEQLKFLLMVDTRQRHERALVQLVFTSDLRVEAANHLRRQHVLNC